MNRGEGEDFENDVIPTVMPLLPRPGSQPAASMAHPPASQQTLSRVGKSQSGATHPHHVSQSPNAMTPSQGTKKPTRENSPQSSNSESGQHAPIARRIVRGCRFETGMAQAKRRVPYSLGPEKLAPDAAQSKRTLAGEEAQKLTSAMEDLYQQLLPSPESEDRRSKFVHKLENLLQSRWPGKEIKVSVFGSTGNYLGTSDSDLDICITTDHKEMESVCLIAEALAANGMQRIVCVSSAKVPIVKVWDPELQIACDMNVNNPIALENTQLIRSYIQIDPRVRPLAMIVKHWAKKRMLNDAALGGTLSSYTWICMVLNFLQTRQPPILPSLQQGASITPVILGGVNVFFDKDLDSYKAYGERNTSNLGELLFLFFRYLGYELDYEANVLSVRLGKTIPKSQKSWHLLQDNRLCVEEPFNTSRNLANTADDTSMRGIHLEMRRAFKLLAKGDFLQCCEEYVPVPEEHRQTSTFIQPTSGRPIIPQTPSQPQAQTSRNAKGNYRGAKGNNRGPGSRRSSNTASRNPNYLHDLPFQMTPQELQLQAQHQQHLLHDQLFQQYQYLQLQEQELRMQLYQQSMRQRGLMSGQGFAQPLIAADSPMRMSVSPSVYQHRFGTNSSFTMAASPTNGVMTNPASPLLSQAVLDGRRYTRRTSMATSGPSGSLRAHSQPARSVPGTGTLGFARPNNEAMTDQTDMSDRRSSIASRSSATNFSQVSYSGTSATLYEAGRRPVEYMGYYIGQSPLLAARSQSTAISPIPSHAGLAIHSGGISPELMPHRLGPWDDDALLSASSERAMRSSSPPPPMRDPRVMDGTLNSPKRRQQMSRSTLTSSANYTISTTTSEDAGADTPATSEEHFLELADQPLSSIADTSVQQHLDVPKQKFSNLATSDESDLNTLLMHGTHQLVAQEHDANAQQLDVRQRRHEGELAPSLSVQDTPLSQPVLVSKTNGSGINGSVNGFVKVTDAATVWQTQKKKRKARKGTKSENDVVSLNHAGGDLLPQDETLRKGG